MQTAAKSYNPVILSVRQPDFDNPGTYLPEEIIYQAQPKQAEFHHAIDNRHLTGVDKFLGGGAAGGGKAAPLNALFLTPFGFKRNEEVQQGDLITNPDGSVAEVIITHPISLQEEYVIHFHDGTQTSCSKEHLWLAWRSGRTSRQRNIRTHGQASAKIVTAERLQKWLQKSEEQVAKGERPNHPLIPVNVEVPFNVPNNGRTPKINPYLLGALLGDGHLSEKSVFLTSMDLEHTREFLNKNNYSYTEHKNNTNDCKSHSFKFKGKTRLELQHCLRIYGLIDKRSDTKFIPESYKYASIEERYQIVQGLMDTDGTVDKMGRIYFTSTSKQLIDDITFILRSLGAVVTKYPVNTYYKNLDGSRKYCKDAHIIYIKHRTPAKLFALERKKVRTALGKDKMMYKRVVKIEVKDKVPMRCITVSHPNGLYICDDFIVTHNSVVLRWLAHRECLTHKRLRVLLIRGTFAELETTHIDKIQYDFPLVYDAQGNQKSIIKYNTQKRLVTYVETGSTLKFGYGDSPDDFRQYLSTDYDIILIDELTTIPFTFVIKLMSRLRTSTPGFLPFFAAATNPGDISHNEVKSFFIDKDFDAKFPQMAQEYDPSTVHFLPFNIYDNPALLANNPTYIKRLKNMAPNDVKRFLHGSWDIFEGQFFESFSRDIHEIDFAANGITRDAGWLSLIGMDYGNVTVAYKISLNPKMGIYYVWWEWKEENKEDTQLANSFYNHLVNWGDLSVPVYFDNNMDARTINMKAMNIASAANIFRKKGIIMRPVVKSGDPDKHRGFRESANSRFKDLLNWSKTEGGWWVIKPHIFFNKGYCNYLMETLPQLQTNPQNDRDILQKPNTKDHGYDACKMGVMSHQLPRDTQSAYEATKAELEYQFKALRG